MLTLRALLVLLAHLAHLAHLVHLALQVQQVLVALKPSMHRSARLTLSYSRTATSW